MYRDKFIVPCYDIDVVWHTHQVRYEYFPFTIVMSLAVKFVHDRIKAASCLTVKIYYTLAMSERVP